MNNIKKYIFPLLLIIIFNACFINSGESLIFETIESLELTKLHKENLQEINPNYKIYIVAIIAEWCGDCHRVIPVLDQIANSSDKIELRFLDKETNMDLVKTTNGGEKIPIVMYYSQDGHHIANWIERPTIAYKQLAEMYNQVGFNDKDKIIEGW